MAHGRNKHQSRENRARVRQIFLREWDPIGVKDIPEASDEYDAYADKAYVMLMDDGASAEDIAAYLYSIAADQMGLGRQPRLEENSWTIAQLLVTLRPDFRTH